MRRGWSGVGPARGGEDLTKSLARRKIARFVPTMLVPTARCLPPVAGSMQLVETHRTSYWRPSDSVVVKNERYNQTPFCRHRVTPSSSSLKRSCQAAHLKVDLTPLIMSVTSVFDLNPRPRGYALIYHIS